MIEGNAKKIAEVGTKNALTGPIERNDIVTVRKHLAVLDGNIRDIYLALSNQLVSLAEKKHPEQSYEKMKKELNEEKK